MQCMSNAFSSIFYNEKIFYEGAYSMMVRWCDGAREGDREGEGGRGRAIEEEQGRAREAHPTFGDVTRES